MKEYVLWGTNPLDDKGSRPISEKVYDKEENERRKQTAIKNGWQNVYTQIINLNENESEIIKNFIKSIKK